MGAELIDNGGLGEEVIVDNEDEVVVDDEGTVVDESTTEDGLTEQETLYTQEQVQNAVKARVSTFNKKLDKMKPYETAVNRIKDITGLDVDTLVSRLEGMSDAEQAKILGITPEQVASKRKIAESTRTANEHTKQLQFELDEQKLMSDPKFKDYPLFKEDIKDLVDENPRLTLKQAYTLVKGETANQAAVRDAEQRAIAKMTKSSNQQMVRPGASVVKSGTKIDQATITAAKRVGMDPAEYAAYANISDLDSYEKFKVSKKG